MVRSEATVNAADSRCRPHTADANTVRAEAQVQSWDAAGEFPTAYYQLN